jgi:predicted ester cyclase
VPLLSQATRRNPAPYPSSATKISQVIGNQDHECHRGCKKSFRRLESSRCRRDRRTFAEGGTYSNPFTGEGVTGEAIGTFARGVFAAFPDVSFELIGIGDIGGGLVAFEWLARATNSGPGLDGAPPTGRSVRMPGATFIQVEGDKIRSERVYHGRQIMAEQLGGTATESA